MPSDRISVNVVSRTQVAGTTRSQVAFGQLFSYVKKNGTVKPEKFAALGASDRLYSIKLGNGALSGSDLTKGRKPVVLIGTWGIEVTRFKAASDYRKEHRRHLQVGQVYRVKDSGAEYVHLGTLNNGRFLSVNISSRDYATTEVGDKEVVLIGTSTIVANTLR